MSTHNFQILSARLLELSNSKVWAHARHEWRLDRVENLEDGEDFETCMCTHHPIKELCYLRNVVNNNEAMVGNVCVNKFMGLGSEVIFASLRRIRKDVSCGISVLLANYALKHKLISQWEHTFSLDNIGRRKLSLKQHTKREEINRRLLCGIRRRHLNKGESI